MRLGFIRIDIRLKTSFWLDRNETVWLMYKFRNESEKFELVRNQFQSEIFIREIRSQISDSQSDCKNAFKLDIYALLNRTLFIGRQYDILLRKVIEEEEGKSNKICQVHREASLLALLPEEWIPPFRGVVYFEKRLPWYKTTTALHSKHRF